MRGAISLGRILGINVYIHFTFFLIFLWVGYQVFDAGGSWVDMLLYFGIMCMVFLSVLMHEYGHALAARRFGIGTRRIVLLPIGGVAQIERMPESPNQEIFVTVMGPAVNLAIAFICLPFIWSDLSQVVFDYSSRTAFEKSINPLFSSFIGYVFWYNCILLLFNLIPAFPMDGGRLLRALLNMRLGLKRSTHIAARIGQALAVLFLIWGFYRSPTMILLGIFVFIGAEMELRMVSERTGMRGLTVLHGMLTRFTTLQAEDPLQKAAQQLLAGSEKDFLVEVEGRIAGVITRDILIKALTENGIEKPVGAVMKTEVPILHPQQPLEDALQVMRTHDINVLPVYDGERFLGAISLENITELMLLKGALASLPPNSKSDFRAN